MKRRNLIGHERSEEKQYLAISIQFLISTELRNLVPYALSVKGGGHMSAM